MTVTKMCTRPWRFLVFWEISMLPYDHGALQRSFPELPLRDPQPAKDSESCR